MLSLHLTWRIGKIPFQIDRAQSARVGNMATLSVKVVVGEPFRLLPMEEAQQEHVRARGDKLELTPWPPPQRVAQCRHLLAAGTTHSRGDFCRIPIVQHSIEAC